jgi:hypothetical protein
MSELTFKPHPLQIPLNEQRTEWITSYGSLMVLTSEEFLTGLALVPEADFLQEEDKGEVTGYNIFHLYSMAPITALPMFDEDGGGAIGWRVLAFELEDAKEICRILAVDHRAVTGCDLSIHSSDLSWHRYQMTRTQLIIDYLKEHDLLPEHVASISQYLGTIHQPVGPNQQTAVVDGVKLAVTDDKRFPEMYQILTDQGDPTGLAIGRIAHIQLIHGAVETYVYNESDSAIWRSSFYLYHALSEIPLNVYTTTGEIMRSFPLTLNEAVELAKTLMAETGADWLDAKIYDDEALIAKIEGIIRDFLAYVSLPASIEVISD